MKKPIPADYGYMSAGQGYDEDYRIDWQFEGGEEAYNRALEKYQRYVDNTSCFEGLKSKFAAQGADDTEVVGIAFSVMMPTLIFAQLDITLSFAALNGGISAKRPEIKVLLVSKKSNDTLKKWLTKGSGAGWSPSFLITSRKPPKYDVPIEELQQGLAHRVLWFDADEATNNFFFEFLELVQLDKEGHFDNLPSIDIVALDKAVGKELFDGNAIFIEVKK